MLKGISVAMATALISAMAPAAAHAADTSATTSAASADRAARWHVTGKWKGKRVDTMGSFYRQRVQLRMKRTRSGGIRGSATYRTTTGSGSVVCKTTLKRVKAKHNGWQVYKEHRWYGDNDLCENGKVRVHRWTKGKLKVRWVGAEFEGTLRRP